MIKNMKNADAKWNISCDTRCPYCNEYIDVMDVRDWFDFLPKPGDIDNAFNGIVTCPYCNKEFLIKQVMN